MFFDRGEYLVIVSRRRRDDALDPLDSVLFARIAMAGSVG